jgi:ribonuclease P protein subunit RPR2
MATKSITPATRKIARERIAMLFGQAEEFFPENPEWSNRCVKLARTIAMRQRVRIKQEFRRKYCRHCYAYLVPGVNMRVRIYRGRVIVTCLNCHRQTRFYLEKGHGKEKQ